MPQHREGQEKSQPLLAGHRLKGAPLICISESVPGSRASRKRVGRTEPGEMAGEAKDSFRAEALQVLEEGQVLFSEPQVLQLGQGQEQKNGSLSTAWQPRLRIYCTHTVRIPCNKLCQRESVRTRSGHHPSKPGAWKRPSLGQGGEGREMQAGRESKSLEIPSVLGRPGLGVPQDKGVQAVLSAPSQRGHGRAGKGGAV